MVVLSGWYLVVAVAAAVVFVAWRAHSLSGGAETMGDAEFKRVLPGRYTPTARSEALAVAGSGYAWAMTAYDVRTAEQPVLYVWGRNDAGAEEVALGVGGRTVHRAPVGSYFGVAFALEREGAFDADLTDLSFTFTGGAGEDVTSRFARW